MRARGGYVYACTAVSFYARARGTFHRFPFLHSIFRPFRPQRRNGRRGKEGEETMEKGHLGRGRFREMTGHSHRQAFVKMVYRDDAPDRSMEAVHKRLRIIDDYDRGGAARERAIRVVDDAEEVQ